MFNPVEAAHANPYFKRNHLGKVTCTLCNIYCNDENCFNRHIEGKTHTLRLRAITRSAVRRKRIEEDEKAYARAEAEAATERAVRELAGKAAGGSNAVNSATHALASSHLSSAGKAGALVTGKFGTPSYTFRTEHDTSSARRATQVWLEFFFPQAEEGTRPLHRWRSAREQQVEEVIDEYFIYLLVACEGYTTVALKFPSVAVHLDEWQAESVPLRGGWGGGAGAHRPGRNNTMPHNNNNNYNNKSPHLRQRHNHNGNNHTRHGSNAVGVGGGPLARSGMPLDKRQRGEDGFRHEGSSMNGSVRSYEYSWNGIRKVYSIYMLLSC